MICKKNIEPMGSIGAILYFYLFLTIIDHFGWEVIAANIGAGILSLAVPDYLPVPVSFNG